mgnify:CR=1 FL=1
MDLDKDQLLHAYRRMVEIRSFEERLHTENLTGDIDGFIHLYAGQEAIAVGICEHLTENDFIGSTHRGHGHCIAKGCDINEMMSEIFGKANGSCAGKGGSMHMFSTDKKFYGGHGIVGAQVPIGAGLGFANKYLDNKAVSLAFFGDGASNQGQVYETFNMAKLWDLPVVFVIENNQYAMGTSVERSSAETELYKRGISFEIEGIEVDGMNVLEVRDAAQKAIDHARDGKGPMILEMKTYRYRGHSMSDPAKYRSRDEVTKTRSERDPIDAVRAQLLDKKWADEATLKDLDKEIKDIVKDAADFSLESPEPDPSELWTDVLLEA